MCKEQFANELNSILTEINRVASESAAVSNSQVYARLRRAKQDIIEAIGYLK